MGGAEETGDSLSRISTEVRVCTKCPLCLSRTKAVPGEGSQDARVVVIGEGPGRNEDLEGRPFVGAAGKELDKLLLEAGLRREGVYVTNVVKCRPPDNRRPTSAEADACDPYLQRQLNLIRPAIVVLLGDSALRRFLPNESLGKAHGTLFVELRFSLFPTYHPAAMMYNRGLQTIIVEDFKKLKKILQSI